MSMTFTWVIPPREPVRPSNCVTLALTGSESMGQLNINQYNISHISYKMSSETETWEQIKEKRILAVCNIVAEARNVFKTDFQPLPEDKETKTNLLNCKLVGEYQSLLSHLNEQTPKGIKNEEPDLVTKLVSTMQDDTQKKTIKTFDKFEKDIGDKRDDVSETSMLVSKRIQMNLTQSTRLGTIRASSLRRLIKPVWHPPFKLYRVIAGHQGWVRSIAVSPCNTFFATGSADRTVKFWDLASGELKMSLTGHINTIRAVQFSKNHPYLFSCGEDKSVKCWDLQMNKVIRNYHGHLSGVYCLKIHDDLSILVSGGRDSAARVWDIRVRKQIYALVGHSHTVGSVLTQNTEPHVITGSHDSFVKLWDLGSGRCIKTLTNHKKSIRAMVEHPTERTFATAASDNIKVWKSPEGEFLRNISGHHSIIDALAINADGVVVSGGDDGTMKFWDWKSGYNFQQIISQPQPGSIAAENGIFSLTFDRSGTRLLSGECDKTIKMWRQDETATEQSHPIQQFKMEFQR